MQIGPATVMLVVEGTDAGFDVFRNPPRSNAVACRRRP